MKVRDGKYYGLYLLRGNEDILYYIQAYELYKPLKNKPTGRTGRLWLTAPQNNKLRDINRA